MTKNELMREIIDTYIGNACKALNIENEAEAITHKAKKLKSGIRAKMCGGAPWRAEEEHGTAHHVVCAVQFVDGAR